MNTGWSHSKKRAGIYFIHPGHGSTWHQELPDCTDKQLREAIRLTYEYFVQTVKRLRKEAEDADAAKEREVLK